jgi:ankyrin repeat protein
VSNLRLVPLHNSCSYGHFEISEILIKNGANVNATDLWQVLAFKLNIKINLQLI